MLPSERLDRFARHIVLPEIGGAGQVALANSHVTLVGVGGIGSPVLQYLAAAGIGSLTLIDDDVVEASNLQRQTLFGEADIGRGKAGAAREWVSRFDPALSVVAVERRIDAELRATDAVRRSASVRFQRRCSEGSSTPSSVSRVRSAASTVSSMIVVSVYW